MIGRPSNNVSDNDGDRVCVIDQMYPEVVIMGL